MALAITNLEYHDAGSLLARTANIATDSSYPTGGESLTPADLGLSTIKFLAASANAGYVPEYDYTNQKLKLYYGDNNNASDGPLIEVPNTTDLSATVTGIKIYAVGV